MGFGSNIMYHFKGLVLELGLFLFILGDVYSWVFKPFDLARWVEDSGFCSLKKEFFWLNEHEKDFKTGYTSSLVSHNLTNDTFGFQNSAIFAFINDKNKQRIIEASSIAY